MTYLFKLIAGATWIALSPIFLPWYVYRYGRGSSWRFKWKLIKEYFSV